MPTAATFNIRLSKPAEERFFGKRGNDRDKEEDQQKIERAVCSDETLNGGIACAFILLKGLVDSWKILPNMLDENRYCASADLRNKDDWDCQQIRCWRSLPKSFQPKYRKRILLHRAGNKHRTDQQDADRRQAITA